MEDKRGARAVRPVVRVLLTDVGVAVTSELGFSVILGGFFFFFQKARRLVPSHLLACSFDWVFEYFAKRHGIFSNGTREKRKSDGVHRLVRNASFASSIIPV